MAAIAVGVALLAVWAGLVLSAVIDLPPSFFIVAVAVLLSCRDRDLTRVRLVTGSGLFPCGSAGAG